MTDFISGNRKLSTRDGEIVNNDSTVVPVHSSVQTSTDISEISVPRDTSGFTYDGDVFTVSGTPAPERQLGDRYPEPDEMPDGPYGRAARAYWDAGWQPLPLPSGKKFPPPTGYTGETAYEKKLTADQVNEWSRSHRFGNTALRMPHGALGIDVDDYAKGSVVKPGGATIRQLIEQYGPLPKTVMSTARPDSIGQLLYRIPESAGIVVLPGVLGPGIEAIQHHHRYTVAWPSTNPDADGAMYRFWLPDEGYDGDDFWTHRHLADEGFIPRVDGLPELPESWCHVVPIGGRKGVVRGQSVAPLGSYEIDRLLNQWAQNDDLDPHLTGSIIDTYQSAVRSGKARHDSCLSALTWAFKAGAAELIDPGPAVNTLEMLFASDTHDRHIPGEFQSMCAWAAANGPQDAAAYRAKWDRNKEARTTSTLPQEATDLWATSSVDSAGHVIPPQATAQTSGAAAVTTTIEAPAAPASTNPHIPAQAAAEVPETFKPRIVFRRASQVQLRRTDWLWDTTPEGAMPTSQGRIPKAMLTMAAGLPGTGKSQYAIWMTAQLTRGLLPGCFYGTPMNVVYAATEDDWERTIAPRLIAAGADLDRVFHVAVQTVEMRTLRISVPEHVDELGEFARDNDVALVVLDPLISHLGGNLKNPNAEKDVRDATEPLVKAAAKYGFTVLGLGHFNKDSKTSDPMERLMGSRGFSALLRALIVFAKDKDAEDEETTEIRYVLSQAKNNLGRSDMPSYSYTIQSAIVPTDEGNAYVSRFVLGPETETSVEAQMASAGRSDEERDAQNDCKGWLKSYLIDEGGESTKTMIESDGKKAGYSPSTLYRARKALKLKVVITGFGGGKVSVWKLPEA